MTIKTVGIIGAGQMGNGIAHVCAQHGFEVLLNDIDPAQLEKALTTIQTNLDRQIKKGLLTDDQKQKALSYLKTTSSISDLSVCDLVIEAATEKEEIKKSIFKTLTPHLKKTALVASNTSSISITRLATYTDRPEQFMGIHFMNPVPVMKLVELIRGMATSEETFIILKKFVEQLGKITAVSQDFPAFIINRILMPMVNEAIYTLYEGVGDIVSIDTGMKLGTNQPMGPLELADFIGLDTCLAVMNVLYDGFSDCKYRPCPLLVKYVEAGWLGRKTKRGFYDYSGDTPIPTR